MTMNLIRTILFGGCCAGVLDFIGACVSNASRGVTPLRIAQSIATGLLVHVLCAGLPIALAARWQAP